MHERLLAEVVRLPVDKRIEFAEAIWDSISLTGNLPLNDAQCRELDRSLDDTEDNPSASIPWEEVRSRLQSRPTASGGISRPKKPDAGDCS